MKKLLLAVALLTLVGACSSTNDEYQDPWVGISEEEVITRLGLPSRSYAASSQKYLVYGGKGGSCQARGCGVSQGFTPTYVVSNAGYVFPVGSSFKPGCGANAGANSGTENVNVRYCTFVIVDGIVETHSGCSF